MCVCNKRCVKAGKRPCRTESREGMLVSTDGDLLVLCVRILQRLILRKVYKAPRLLFISTNQRQL
jgi:hypothetical protein